MSLYLTVLLLSISVPITLSFDKKLAFYKQWKYVLPAIAIVAFFHLLIDIYLTKHGIWGFNPQYHSNILLFNLPIEEWLFFIVIPYACIFLHEALILYFPRFKMNSASGKIVSVILIIAMMAIILFNVEKIYTVLIFSTVIIALILSFFDKSKVIDHFYLTFLVILIPFIAVNAVLTGSFIDGTVFWYNKDAILEIRIFTIPVEDFAYAFSMILFNLLLIARLKKQTKIVALSDVV